MGREGRQGHGRGEGGGMGMAEEKGEIQGGTDAKEGHHDREMHGEDQGIGVRSVIPWE